MTLNDKKTPKKQKPKFDIIKPPIPMNEILDIDSTQYWQELEKAFKNHKIDLDQISRKDLPKILAACDKASNKLIQLILLKVKSKVK